MVIESVIVTGVMALMLYSGARWLGGENSKHDAAFRRQVLKEAAEIATQDNPADRATIERAFLQGHKIASVLRVECVLQKVSASTVVCKTVVALPHQQGAVLRSIKRELSWEDLPSQVRADFMKHGTEDQVYLLYSSVDESSEAHA